MVSRKRLYISRGTLSENYRVLNIWASIIFMVSHYKMDNELNAQELATLKNMTRHCIFIGSPYYLETLTMMLL